MAALVAACANPTVEGGGGRGGTGGGGGGNDGSAGGGSAGGGGAGGSGGSAGAGGAGGTGASGGSDGSTDAGGKDSGSDGSGDSTKPGSKPDCTKRKWTIINADRPHTADEMYCFVSGQREVYGVHGRASGCSFLGGGGSGAGWPLAMTWDAALAAEAQKEADRVNAGGAPRGIPEGGLTFDGCGSSRYWVTATMDREADWGKDGDLIGSAALAQSNPVARVRIYYYDGEPGGPTLTKLGSGLATNAKMERTWVLLFGK